MLLFSLGHYEPCTLSGGRASCSVLGHPSIVIRVHSVIVNYNPMQPALQPKRKVEGNLPKATKSCYTATSEPHSIFSYTWSRSLFDIVLSRNFLNSGTIVRDCGMAAIAFTSTSVLRSISSCLSFCSTTNHCRWMWGGKFDVRKLHAKACRGCTPPEESHRP